MRLAAIAMILASGSLLAQRNAVSPSGFGRVMFPGGGPTGAYGGAPAVNPYGNVLFPGTGAPAAIRPGVGYPVGGGGYVPPRPPNVGHGGHGNTAIVPYPVFYGGGYYNYEAPYAGYIGMGQAWPTPGQPGFSNSFNTSYGQPAYPQSGQPAAQQQDPSPVVVINQYFRPDEAPTTQTTRVPSTTTVTSVADTQAAPSSSEMQNIFLIAMKDHTIYAANSYWVENNTLNYITVQGMENTVSLDLVDRDMSQRLNRDRKVSFGLPKN